MEIMETIKYIMFLGGFVAFVLAMFGLVLFAAVYQTVREKVHEARRRRQVAARGNWWEYIWVFERTMQSFLKR
jgi:multisubunit Na+/H+ antiporter MnhG subunit